MDTRVDTSSFLAACNVGLPSGAGVIRPAGEADIPLIAQYLREMTPDDRHNRFQGTIAADALTNRQRLARRYTDIDFALHAAFVVQTPYDIAGIVHAFEEKPRVYEVSFSRHIAYRGHGIGKMLMDRLLLWAHAIDAMTLYADTYMTNRPMCRLFDHFGFVRKVHPEDRELFHYTYQLSPA